MFNSRRACHLPGAEACLSKALYHLVAFCILFMLGRGAGFHPAIAAKVLVTTPGVTEPATTVPATAVSSDFQPLATLTSTLYHTVWSYGPYDVDKIGESSAGDQGPYFDNDDPGTTVQGFIGYCLDSIPLDAHIVGARLTVTQDATHSFGHPYSLGTLFVERATRSAKGLRQVNERPPLPGAQKLFVDASTSTATVDVTHIVRQEWLEHQKLQDGARTVEFRLRFEQPSNHNRRTDEVILNPGTLNVTYVPAPLPTPAPTPIVGPPIGQPGHPIKGKIAFVSARDGSSEIYVMNDDGSNQTRLTHVARPGEYNSLDFSADGSRIVFSYGVLDAHIDEGGSYYDRYLYNLYVMNADGSGRTQVTCDGDDEHGYYYPRFSHDGRHIAYMRDNNAYVMNADGTQPMQLTASGGSILPSYSGGLAWSPDDREIVCSNTDQELVSISISDKTLHLIGTAYPYTFPDFRADGKRILFNDTYSTLSVIEPGGLHADGTGRARIPTPLLPSWGARYSPDGQRIVFAASLDLHSDLFTMLLDSSRLHRLTNNWAEDRQPAWGPGSVEVPMPTPTPVAAPLHDTIAYVQHDAYACARFCSYTDNIYVMRSDGTHGRQLTGSEGNESDPAISPDGRRIAFVSDRDGNPEIYWMNADGSGLTQLSFTRSNTQPHYPYLTSGVINANPAWSPDGNRIAFVRSNHIFVMSADGSAQTPLAPNPDNAIDASPTWSPDGHRLAFTRNGVLYLMNSNGSNVGPFPSTQTLSGVSDPAWSPDGTTIAYAASGSLFTVQVAQPDAPPLFLTGSDVITGQPPLHPAWGPDSQRLTFYTPSVEHCTEGCWSVPGHVYIISIGGTDLKALRYMALGKGIAWH